MDVLIIIAIVMILMWIGTIVAVIIFGRSKFGRNIRFEDWIYGWDGTFVGFEKSYKPNCTTILFRPTKSFRVERRPDVPKSGFMIVKPWSEKCPQEDILILFNDGQHHTEPTLIDRIKVGKVKELSQILEKERMEYKTRLAAESTAKKLMTSETTKELKEIHKLLSEMEKVRTIPKRGRELMRGL
ncbi:MAG: hypothetical protein ACTSX6_03305 [Candidatus Heimdallarchaeaceae archaeon]